MKPGLADPPAGQLQHQRQFVQVPAPGDDDGEFRRVITLPDDVDPDRVEAKYRDGVLQITVQRREAVRPRQITVN